MSIKAVVALVLAAVIAAGLWWGGNALYQAGYDARDAIVVRDQLRAADKAIEATKTNVQTARAADVQIQAELKTELAAATSRAEKLDRALKKQETRRADAPPQDPTVTPEPVLLGRSVLDVFTLCLLNAERAGVASPGSACAPERTDEEIDAAAATPSDVTGGDLARNDQEVARLFNELAKRHDGLVDWVDQNIINGK